MERLCRVWSVTPMLNTFDSRWPGPVGVDVSAHQRDIAWKKFADAGVSFAYIKATEGCDWRDPRYKQNVRKATAAGILVGLYHFARPSSRHRDGIKADALAEAEDFATAHTSMFRTWPIGVMPPALDIEWGGAKGVSRYEATLWCETFLAELWGLTGIRPIVYSGPAFTQYKLDEGERGGELDLAEYPLWQADYSRRWRQRPRREMPNWPWLIWQHSGEWPRPDGRGKVDANRFRGSMEDLKMFAGLGHETGVSWLDKMQSALVRMLVR